MKSMPEPRPPTMIKYLVLGRPALVRFFYIQVPRQSGCKETPYHLGSAFQLSDVIQIVV